jgi:hypothetical protein
LLALLASSLWYGRVQTQSSAATTNEIQNVTGVRVKPTGDATRPVLNVWLPGQAAPSAIIEFPEHAWGKANLTDEPSWFYHLYRQDPQFRGRGSWTSSGNTLRYALDLPSGARIRGVASLAVDGLTLEYEITWNGRTLAEVQAPTCIKLYRPFTDVFLERTYTHHADGLELLASDTPERLSRNAEEWLPCRYLARCEPPSISPQQRVERQPDGVIRYTKLKLADAPFIATESAPAGWVAATHALNCPTVWTNPARTCHHADASSALRPGAPARLGAKLYLVRGTVNDAWAVVRKNRATKTL